MEDLFPSTYVEAQCLCSGCLRLSGSPRQEPLLWQSHGSNSVPLRQRRVFLRRERCGDGLRYRLRPVSLQVAVGCTCAWPKFSS